MNTHDLLVHYLLAFAWGRELLFCWVIDIISIDTLSCWIWKGKERLLANPDLVSRGLTPWGSDVLLLCRIIWNVWLSSLERNQSSHLYLCLKENWLHSGLEEVMRSCSHFCLALVVWQRGLAFDIFSENLKTCWCKTDIKQMLKEDGYLSPVTVTVTVTEAQSVQAEVVLEPEFLIERIVLRYLPGKEPSVFLLLCKKWHVYACSDIQKQRGRFHFERFPSSLVHTIS